MMLQCPACNHTKLNFIYISSPDYVCQCRKCQAIFGKFEHLETSYKFVATEWDHQDINDETCYFDFTGNLNGKTQRRHGYYNPSNLKIQQVG